MIINAQQLIIGYNSPLTTAFDLKLSQGQWTGIIGKNGTGKSTFFKTLLGIIEPYAGELQVLGKKPGRANSLISYIPQERTINLASKMSGLSLIKASYHGWQWGISSFNKKIKKKAYEILEIVGATEYMNQPFATLSGGQKKRIYLAQALINEPELLLMDEPLADLDPAAKQSFIQSLQAIGQHKKLSLLIISHDMHEIAKYLSGFVHFQQQNVHYCNDLPCAGDDAYVGI